MIRKCANPTCDIEFRSSHQGRLFRFEIKSPTEPCRDVPAVICEKKPGRATVYFWLCERCCGRFTLQFTESAGVRLMPAGFRARRSAANEVAREYGNTA